MILGGTFKVRQQLGIVLARSDANASCSDANAAASQLLRGSNWFLFSGFDEALRLRPPPTAAALVLPQIYSSPLQLISVLLFVMFGSFSGAEP